MKIKRINYVKEVQHKVYERMMSERKRAAEQFRSEGQGKKAEIEGRRSVILVDSLNVSQDTTREIAYLVGRLFGQVG